MELAFRNVKLLSFGDNDGAEAEDGESVVLKKKDMARPDCGYLCSSAMNHAFSRLLDLQ